MRKRMMVVALAVAGLLAALVTATVPRPSPDDDQPAGQGVLTATSTYAINTNDRVAVNRAYQTRWRPAFGAGPGWTGSVSGCRKGSVSDTYVRRLAGAINFVRALNKLDPVTVARDRYSSSSSYSIQATALIMRANRALSHYPPSSWRCWTRPGATGAARSVLSLTFDGVWTAGRALTAYLNDGGAANVAVGHRRWLTTPWARTYYVGGTSNTNALMPVLASTSTPRRNPAFTAWPTAGWFPVQLDPAGRWSWSSRETRADLSRARVRVWKDGRALTVRQYAARSGYGQPTLVWQMPAESRRVGTYTISVSGVRSASGTLRPATTYRVSGFVAW